MSIKPAKTQFNGGELSPWLEGRTDVAQYDKTAKLCRNFIPLAEGCLKRRGGTKFVAMTPEDAGVTLTIYTEPEAAVVTINDIEGKELTLERGATVEVEVTCEGYRPYHGYGVVVDNAYVSITLVKITSSCVLEIVTQPHDAIVMIEGVERRRYVAEKNSKAAYKVSREYYHTQENAVILQDNMTLNIHLQPTAEYGVYGDWGLPLYFVACAQVGDFKNWLKSFVIRFEHGYLAVMFSSQLIAPDSHYDIWFVYDEREGYNSVACKDDTYYLTDLQVSSDAFRYKDLNGKAVFAVDLALSAAIFGWAVDENGHYAAYYPRYDGEIRGHIISIKYDGKEVWQIKERTI